MPLAMLTLEMMLVMQSFANDKSLGLELVASNVGGPHGDRQRKVMLWQKL